MTVEAVTFKARAAADNEVLRAITEKKRKSSDVSISTPVDRRPGNNLKTNHNKMIAMDSMLRNEMNLPALSRLDTVATPFLALDAERLTANIDRLSSRINKLGATLRPHMKTAKSVDVAKRVFDGGIGPITVSTLKEAEYFAGHGFTDILYGVGISPDKLARVVRLIRRGVDLQVFLDSPEQANAVAEACVTHYVRIPVLIEIDCDGHRGGLVPDDVKILDIARALNGKAELRGVASHAGESYFCRSPEALAEAAERERAKTCQAADFLRRAGFECAVVSVGSTPTAHFAADLSGITEIRAGVYMFFDLVMAGIGVCQVADIATSVVATVIGHRPEKGWIITDGGWMAMSRDRGTSRQPVDQAYGIVAALDGTIYDDLLMSDASQEHGILSVREGRDVALPDLPLGSRVRIFPNHACATAAQFDSYHVTSGTLQIDAVWPRIRGW